MWPLQAARVNEHLSMGINFGSADALYRREQPYVTREDYFGKQEQINTESAKYRIIEVGCENS